MRAERREGRGCSPENSPGQWFSTGDDFAPSSEGHLAASGNIFGCHICEGSGATGIWWVEARDAAKHPTMHRTAPHSKA